MTLSNRFVTMESIVNERNIVTSSNWFVTIESIGNDLNSMTSSNRVIPDWSHVSGSECTVFRVQTTITRDTRPSAGLYLLHMNVNPSAMGQGPEQRRILNCLL